MEKSKLIEILKSTKTINGALSDYDCEKIANAIMDIKESVDCEFAEIESDGKCLGYGTQNSDEPCEQCKGCPKCSGYERD